MSELQQALGQAELSALYYYPIKSCAGKQAASVQVEPRGIRHDRELMLVEAGSGEFLTQRELPRMALIRPQIQAGRLLAEAPAAPDLDLLLTETGPVVAAKIWKDNCEAVDQGEEAARWFSLFLGLACRLVRLAPGFTRRVDPRYARSKQDQVGLADGFPFLLISQESLDNLNSRMAAPLPMNRFRPNLVIAGSGKPFLEDKISRLTIGAIGFEVVKPCARCVITTTDQQTAATAKEPLRTLATFRRGPRGQVMFGQNLIHENNGLLKIGDTITGVG